jgi:hypothetical protein
VSDFKKETPDLVVPDANGYYGSDAHVCDLQLAVEMNGKRVLELEAALNSLADGTWWDGNEPYSVSRVESYVKAVLLAEVAQ